MLVVGVNDLTELYLSSLAEFAPTNLAVVGILSRGRGLHGRLMRQHKVLGAPEDLSRVLAELELHGVTVDRIVVMQPFEQLSKTAQEALLEVERVSAIKVEWLLETLGWRGSESGTQSGPEHSSGNSVAALQRGRVISPYRAGIRICKACDRSRFSDLSRPSSFASSGARGPDSRDRRRLAGRVLAAAAGKAWASLQVI